MQRNANANMDQKQTLQISLFWRKEKAATDFSPSLANFICLCVSVCVCVCVSVRERESKSSWQWSVRRWQGQVVLCSHFTEGCHPWTPGHPGICTQYTLWHTLTLSHNFGCFRSNLAKAENPFYWSIMFTPRACVVKQLTAVCQCSCTHKLVLLYLVCLSFRFDQDGQVFLQGPDDVRRILVGFTEQRHDAIKLLGPGKHTHTNTGKYERAVNDKLDAINNDKD